MTTTATRKRARSRPRQRAIREDFRREYSIPGSVELNSTEFRFTVLRPEFQDPVSGYPIDPFVESVEWRDEGALGELNVTPPLQGSITLRRPQDGDPTPTIHDGHVVICWSKNFTGRWNELWRMRMQEPDLTLEDGTWAFDLADDLQLLGQSTDSSLVYKSSKKHHPHPWTADQITRDVCRKYGVRVHSLVKGTHPIKNLKAASALDAITQAYDLERTHTGRMYVVRWAKRNGFYGLEVVEIKRSAYLFTLARQTVSAHLKHNRRPGFCTAVTVHGQVKGTKGKHKPIKLSYVNKAGAAKYGLIHRESGMKAVDSAAEALERAKRFVAKNMTYFWTADITHPGIPQLRRGDVVRVLLPSVGLKSANVKGEGIFFVSSVTHSLSAGTYTMDISLTYLDALDPNMLRAARERAARQAKAAQRKHKASST